MKKENVPQDLSALGKLTKEVCYTIDESGNYVTQLSSGWDVKINALDIAWKDIDERVAQARQQVQNGEASPLRFFMEYRMMDFKLLADYTGFWQWQIKRHLKPKVFNNLSETKLKKYAEAFNISVADLKTMTVHEN
jgi:peptidyl-tRNA hydrolase